MAEELIRPKRALSGWPMLIFWWAMILFALQASTHMVGAGDTWVAMACGRHFINHGVDTVEPFSANSHKAGPTAEDVKNWPGWAQKITDIVGLGTVRKWHPTGWVNQNWLTHVIFYWLTHDSPFADAETFDKPIEGQNISYNSLVYWKYALYILTVITVYYTGRALGVNPALSACFACFALFVGRTFFDIRPAGFSNMLTAVLLLIFVLAVYKNYLYIWLIVPLTVLWCNLHGGYIYVFIVLVPFIGLHLLMILPKRLSACIYYCVGWMFFYALVLKFRGHEYLKQLQVSPLSDGLFYFILILIFVAILLAVVKNIKPVICGMFYTAATFIVALTAYGRLYHDGLARIMRQDAVFKAYVADARLSFMVMFIGFITAAVLLGLFRSRLKTISVKGFWHTVAASAAAFIAMIIFNPFHLTNLTHTFIVTVDENAKLWKTVNEWHPAFEWKNPVGDEQPFLWMYILAWVLLAFWIVCLLLKPKMTAKKSKAKSENISDKSEYHWPKIDLVLMSIAALTIFMAIGSRRFIPVAAIAACPLMAMFIDSGYKMISARVNLVATGSFKTLAVPKYVQYVFLFWAFVGVLSFSIFWGKKYKTIYLDPWPDSYYLTSEFMRMSASYAKPFKACQFLRDNKVSGKVFNYWTEGGALAYGQIPDPNTGRTPLQLFMDGRAQAAYDTKAYIRWMNLAAGGKIGKNVKRAGRSFTLSDRRQIGQWLDSEFTAENVWVVIMPAAQYESTLVKSLEANGDWMPVFINDQQRIYVDLKQQQGKDLYSGIFTGKTKFPDTFSKTLTVGHNLLRLRDKKNADNGFTMLAAFFTERQYQAVALELLYASSRLPERREDISRIFSDYLDKFVENKNEYLSENGYRERIVSAMIAAEYLRGFYAKTMPQFSNKYTQIRKQLRSEQSLLQKRSRW